MNLCLIASLYLLNPGAGVFELIPDNLALIGNLDEAAVVAHRPMALRYFGIDLPRIYQQALPGDRER